MANGQWGGLRTVLSEKEVSDTIDAECINYPRLREAWDALEWLLARSADKIGSPARTTDTLRLYVQADDALANVPALWIVYRIGEEVEILAVNVSAPVPSDEE